MSAAQAGAGDPHIARARTLANLLDRWYLDPVLGLLAPGVGDAVSGGFGLYLVGVAIHRRLPPVVIARMVLRLAIDTLVGLVPIAGDLFDFVFRANTRNLAMLEARHARGRSAPSDWIVLALALALFVVAITLPLWLASALIVWIC